MNRCLICFSQIEETFNNKSICIRCKKGFEVIEKRFMFESTEVVVLYKYNDFFKDLLYRYKGCYDKELKNAFLNDYLLKLKKEYKGRKVICSPSFYKDDIRRGFNHVKEIFSLLNLEIVDCLTKVKNYKQSMVRYKDRNKIQEYIKIDKSKIKEKDRLLIVDDVATSLSTIKTIIHLLPTKNDKKVCVLASNCRFLENEIN